VKYAIIVLMLAMLFACETERMELASLFNDSEVSGVFFLGCGSIDEVEYLFAWAREDESMGWMRIQTQATHARVYMDEAESPYVLVDPWFGNDVYHVPPGTIIRKYELK
jgi:hypothetical protein